MITFTDAARQKVREYMEMSETPTLGVRVVAHRFGRHQFRYELALVMEGETKSDDEVIDQNPITVYLDKQSAEWLEGASVDFVSDTTGTGFMFTNPQAEVSWDDPLAQRVQQVIDERIAPETMLPAVGQGALAIETRSDDREARDRVRILDHSASRVAVEAERAFLRHLGGGCLAPATASTSTTPSATPG